MADFVAVIRRAVDGLSNNTPEMRVKVYEKARGAVMRQLENMTPKPSEDMLRRQLDKLELAIKDVESEYAEALPAEDETVDAAPAYEPEQVHAPEPYHAEPEPYEEPAPYEEPVSAAEPEGVETAYEPEVAEPVYDDHHVEPWQAPDYSQPAHETPEHDHHVDAPKQMPVAEYPQWASEPEPAAPAITHASETHAADKHGLDSHEMAPWDVADHDNNATQRSTDDDHWAPPVAPAVGTTRAETPAEVAPPYQSPQRQTDHADALGAFDEFVRSQTVVDPKKDATDTADLLNWGETDKAASSDKPARAVDVGTDPAWFDDFVTATKPAAQVDPALQNLTNDSGKRQGTSKDELLATLKKGQNKGKKKAKTGSKSKSGGMKPYILTGALILILAGGGYAAYVNREYLASLANGLTPPAPQTASESGKTDGAKTDGDGVKAATSGGDAQAGAAGQKFTQQLLPDGTEVDRGPSEAEASANEGRSVAQQNVAANTPPANAATAAGAPASKAFTVPANGQKAYLYEERLGETTPATMQGYVVWEEKNETDDNGKPQPVIQGQLAIPEQGLTALITFKRNTDPSLPASHLAEIVFSVPKNFPGGGIDSVQRVAMKQTEQDRGDPIVAVPAKIIDDSFMIAFNDFPEVVTRNISLLRDREWIDIPVTYRNGRRALLTLDKGSVGKKVFDDVIKEWIARGSAKSGG
ncbi:hypothetical protein [Allorhizobium terrae]|uniref:Uncharacterized protein n=1 Tax=Allorhizobium terrae TaxID=1848972 RepID=A0A4S4A5L6_9HYPH|nr:hypothetical protein [Allorhizobium terrae]THF53624.1 hypothetical protein E6C51_00400 [Allorhizobium terrae]